MAVSIEQALDDFKTAAAGLTMKVRERRCVTFGRGTQDQVQSPPQPGNGASGLAFGMPASAV